MYKLFVIVFFTFLVISGNILMKLSSLIVLIIYSEQKASPCPKNEIYNECGSSCPVTCANKDYPPQPCIALCKSGCFCARGYLRNKVGRCVLRKNC